MKSNLNKILVFLFFMPTFPSFSQEGAGTTVGQYYDDRVPELPEKYRAQKYTAEDLMKSLLRAANGPELTRKDIEDEFGLRFVKLPRGNDYVARGSYPLGDELSMYSGLAPGKSFMLRFDGRASASSLRRDILSRPKVCVPNNVFVKELGSRWHRFEFRQSIDRGENVEYYILRKFENHVRRIDVHPDVSIEDKSRWDCVESFSMIYRYEMPLGERLN